jgi:hypothetical protein
MSVRAKRAALAAHAVGGEAAEKGPATVHPLPRPLALGRVVEVDAERKVARIDLGGASVDASIDAAVDGRVLETARARGERVVMVREEAGWVVVGALRTAATPGVDEGDEFVLKARRVVVAAEHEFAVVTGAASFAVRAYGLVETVARDITSRASSLHKIAGRLIRLN